MVNLFKTLFFFLFFIVSNTVSAQFIVCEGCKQSQKFVENTKGQKVDISGVMKPGNYFFTAIEPKSEIWLYKLEEDGLTWSLKDIRDDRGFEPMGFWVEKGDMWKIVFLKDVKFYTNQ